MDALGLLAIAAIVAANAYFVIAEYALVTARRGLLDERARSGSAGARAALRLMNDPVRLIGTVQIGITALGILLGAVGEPVIRDLLGDGVPGWLSFLIGFMVVTYLSVAFGELVPKALALHDPEPIAIRVARSIELMSRASAPGVWVLQTSASAVLRPLGIPSVSAGDRPVSREELLSIVQDAEDTGALHPDEEDMISAIVDLRGRAVTDVMLPWNAVVSADLSRPLGEIAEQFASSRHTRLPVLRGSSGPLVGVLHAKDVWRAERAGVQDITPVVRDAVVVPPSVTVDQVLSRLRAERQHLAVVLDEYGSPLGIVTLEDVLEEIVGEIEDEFDPAADAVARLDAGGYLVAGALSLVDLARSTGLEVKSQRAHSVGGALLEALGRVPDRDEEVVLGTVRLRAVEVEHQRVVRVEVSPTD